MKIFEFAVVIFLQRHVVTSLESPGVRRFGHNAWLHALNDAEVHMGGWLWSSEVQSKSTRALKG